MHLTEAEDLTANAAALGVILGVSERRVQQLVDENGVVQTKRGTYDVAGSVATFLAYSATKRKNQNSGGEGYEAERERLTAAKADMAEMQRDVMAGKLHDADAVRDVWTEVASHAKNKILGMAASLTAQLEGLGMVERKAMLEEYSRAILNEIADYSPERITGQYVEAHQKELTPEDDE